MILKISKNKIKNMMKSMNESKKKISVILNTYQSMNTSIKEMEVIIIIIIIITI